MADVIQQLRVEVNESIRGRMNMLNSINSTLQNVSAKPTTEASLYQVLLRMTANGPLRIVQQTRGQRGFEAWHEIVRRYDQRNMSGTNSAYAALISNISERDRAKDVEQLDDILRTFTSEMNKFEKRFGKIRDEEKMLAVKKLMPESLLNCRFRGKTVSYSELLVALEYIIIYRVATIPTARSRKMTQALQWILELQLKKMMRMRAKRETEGS